MAMIARFQLVTSVLACVALASCTEVPPAAGVPRARVAHTLYVRDEGRLRFIGGYGSQLLDEGRATGSFPGWAKGRFVYNGEPTVSAQLTISGAGGTISARGSGRLSSAVSPSPSFRGRMRVTGGTGRYAHVRGSGELFGVFYRRSDGLSFQAIGVLAY